MSCGHPHEIDCREVIEAVYLYLDDEEPVVDRRAKIRQHLDECGPCLREYGIEAEIKALVYRCCRDEQAPERLRARVLVKLREYGIQQPPT